MHLCVSVTATALLAACATHPDTMPDRVQPDASVDAIVRDDAPLSDTPAEPDSSTDTGSTACLPTALPAPNFYVSTTGNDANDGSFAHPWATITHAATTVSAGSTVHVLPGTYTSSVVTQCNGTAASRIRFISDCRWQARIAPTGSSAIWLNGANTGAASTNGNYVDIVGFDIDGSSSSAAVGILNFGSYSRVMGNHVHHVPAPTGCTDGNGGAGIDDANYGAQDDDVIGNLVHDIGGSSIGTCVHAVVHGVYHANLRGLIQDNVVYRAEAYGIHLWHAATNVVVTNNTVFDNGWFNGSGYVGGGIIVGDGDSPGGVTNDYTTVTNNIIFQNEGEGLREYGAVGTHNLYLNNLINGNGLNTSLLTGSSEGGIDANPSFVNYQPLGSGDYHLTSASPAVDAGSANCAMGTSSCAPAADFEGGARPAGAGLDLGAYEYAASPVAWPWW